MNHVGKDVAYDGNLGCYRVRGSL